MKNVSSLFAGLLLAILCVVSAQAQTIRRVNNNGITGVDVAGTNIYSTLQLAHNAASNGDIIQVEPSTTSYGNLSCSKSLTIVGPGYFLSQNQPPALQASVVPASASQIFFNTGSTGSTITGMTVTYIYLSTSNINVLRNDVNYIYFGYQNASNNIVVRQNYVYQLAYNNYVNNNVLITNNIITYNASLNTGNITGEFSNNSLVGNGGASFDNFTVRNNYFASALTTTANTTWNYNLLAQASLPTLGSQSNNTANVTAASVFVQTSGSNQYDGWYQLKAGTNPARSTGQGGVDIGATGSATGYAYRLAGIPAVPTIYQLNQSVSGNSLNVTIGTRSNN
ncbi:hypothetical protein LJY25_15045 [Hymenobacter sp. BT175]|uniref:hypothetical protein n=1 Tax=Hymenobacter translucens TaxID=2886507 RepID=UPI001D0F296D|nr:hypothetical protein [Hymenobacter translucens]MCC2547767.1 hypothetical protein [Hymenobacter translucens]